MGAVSVMMVMAFSCSPLAAYLPQWWTTKTSKSDGFSNNVCLLLLTANILRIFFWLGRRFDPSLLFQSIAMVFVQLLLLEALVTVKREKSDHKLQHPWDVSQFWNWTLFWPYLLWMLLFVSTVAAFFIPLLHSRVLVDTIGAVGCTLEAAIAVPQIIRNHVRQNTDGLSIVTVMGWCVGDSARLLFLVAATGDIPFHFILSGIFQIITDIIVVLQVTVLYPSKEFISGLKRLRSQLAAE